MKDKNIQRKIVQCQLMCIQGKRKIAKATVFQIKYGTELYTRGWGLSWRNTTKGKIYH